jgi:hypothetical protein
MPSLEPTGRNRRRWQRLPLKVPVRMVVHRSSQLNAINTDGSQLNEGGMCVYSGIPMQPGEQVTLEFKPPSASDLLRLWAAVRNRHEDFYGLEFLAENTGERMQVEQYRSLLRAALESGDQQPN